MTISRGALLAQIAETERSLQQEQDKWDQYQVTVSHWLDTHQDIILFSGLGFAFLWGWQTAKQKTLGKQMKKIPHFIATMAMGALKNTIGTCLK